MHTSPLLRSGTLALSAILLTNTPTRLHAQTVLHETLDTRMRVELHSADRTPLRRERRQLLIGTLAGVSADTVLLMMQPGTAPVRVPFASIQAMYASRGRIPRWKAALRGAAVSAATGALLSTVGSLRGQRTDDRSTAQNAVSGALWGAASGATLASLSPKYRWQRLVVPTLPDTR